MKCCSRVATVNQLSLIHTRDLTEIFTLDSLPNTTLYFIQARDRHRKTQSCELGCEGLVRIDGGRSIAVNKKDLRELYTEPNDHLWKELTPAN